jgi:hypothetical protein
MVSQKGSTASTSAGQLRHAGVNGVPGSIRRLVLGSSNPSQDVANGWLNHVKKGVYMIP